MPENVYDLPGSAVSLSPSMNSLPRQRNRSRRRRYGPRRVTNMVVAYAIVGGGAVLMILPFVAALANSLKTYAQYIAVPAVFWPDPVAWANYVEVWERAPFGLYALNSFIIATFAVIGNVLSSAMVGHALARMRLPARGALLTAALATMMLPTVVTIIPTFILFRQFGWLDTFLPLIVPFWLATPFGIFLMRQAFLAVPKEFEEAATIDGANPWHVFTRVHLPMVKPALATLAVFTFMTSWGAVLEPTVFLTSPEKLTLPIGVMGLRGQFVGNDQFITAAALMSLIPILVLFLVAQRYFVQGSMADGLKG